MTLKQPALGIVSTVICVICALAICSLFTVSTFNTWVGFVVVAAIPGQIILALLWESNYPEFVNKLRQPLKGITLVLLMAIVGAITALISFTFVGGSISPPTPMLIQFTILSVVITMWTVVVWQCWPISAFTKQPSIIGIGTLLVTYLITYVLFWTCFNYSFLASALFYNEAFAPSGKLDAWTAMTFFLTTVAVIDAFILLDFWPISSIQNKLKAFAVQPLTGLLSTVFILAISYGIWHLFITVLQFEKVDYMVRVIVSFVFGEFIMIVLMQTSPFTNIKQPYKGLCLLICCSVLAICMYWLYTLASIYLIGEIPLGAPTYDLDLWLASAMLSITFPLLIIFADFFKFWPIAKLDQE